MKREADGEPDWQHVPEVTEEALAAAVSAMRERLYARQPGRDLDEIDLDGLNDEFAEYARIYESGNLDDQRYAVASQLSLIQDFFAELGITRVTLTPAFRPIEALAERENNRIDPMFAQRKRGGRPRTTSDHFNRVGILAALANFWIETHSDMGTVDVQLAAAARRFKGKWFGRVTAAQLRSARVIVSQEAHDHEAVAAYRHFDTHIHELAANFGPEQALAVTIRILNEAPASSAIGNWQTQQDRLGEQ